MLLKNNPHIVVHIKMVNPPWPSVSFTSPDFALSIIHFIDAMRVVFGNVGIAVVIKSLEVLNNPDFGDIEVGECVTYSGGWLGPPPSTTEQQRALYSNRNYVKFKTRPDPMGSEFEEVYDREIIAYFVGSKNGTGGGCASGGSTFGAALVARKNTDVFTLAHEIGHVLGLSHADPADPTRLMNSTPPYTNIPPDILPSEADRMKRFVAFMHEHC